jgi:adenosylcobinamide kinase/adenosylcobinamide-phosphate guanylyltransferase
MGKLTLILGGARSGKSTYAQKLAEARGACVLFIATALPIDPEMQARIAKHQAERPAGWRTLEVPRKLGDALAAIDLNVDLVILDCLTLLLNNLFVDAGDEENFNEAAVQAALAAELDALEAAVTAGPANWIVVSNEVGLGLVPAYPLGRSYRDLLGWANQRLAAQAEEVYFLAAGIPLPLHEYRDRSA